MQSPLAGRLQHGDGVHQQDPRRRGRPAASASAAGSCPASTSTPTSATRRSEAWGLDWLRAGHDAGPLPPARLRRRTASTSTPGDDGAARAARRGAASCCAEGDGVAARRRAAPSPTRRDWPDVDQVRRPAAGVARVARARHRLRPGAARLPRRPAPASTSTTCARRSPLYADRGRRPPRLDPARRQLRAVGQRPPRAVDPRRVGRAAPRRRPRRRGGHRPRRSSPRSGSTRATASSRSTSSTSPTCPVAHATPRSTPA